MKRLIVNFILLVGLTGLVAGCSSAMAFVVEPTPVISLAYVTPTPTTTPATPTRTPSPTARPTATATPTPAALSVEAIFARVSPSIAFIETPRGSGSGVLTAGRYIVTNAHVVWPYQEVRVVFPDGSEFLHAPVKRWDLLGDLALIGPLLTALEPVGLVDGEELIIGSDVFLIGYPGEVEQFPQPTITRGLISRRREWEPLRMTYFQTDATIAGGQSGGVLVSKTGEVIGISGFSFTEAGFGLVASAADILPRLQRLSAGQDSATLDPRPMPESGGQLEANVSLYHSLDRRVYVINEPAGTMVEIKVESENDAAFALVDTFGHFPIWANRETGGVETGSATLEMAPPYFLIVGQYSDEPGQFKISSNSKFIPYDDVDDGTNLTVGQTVTGNIDYPSDIDYFLLDMEAGEMVSLTVDSILTNPFLSVASPGATEEEIISDDNSGGGIFGLNAGLVYRAPQQGSYLIAVEDQSGAEIGGYFLTVASPPPGAIPAALQPTSTPVVAATTAMAWYQSAQHPFAIEYPAQWAKDPQEEGIAAAYSEDNAGLIIAEEDLTIAKAGEMSLAEYVEVILYVVTQEFENFQLLSRQQIVTAQGLPGEIIVFTAGPGDLIKASMFIYVHENKIGFSAMYVAPRAKYQELEGLIDSSFNTFEIRE